MYKSLSMLCLLCFVVIDGRPRWQFLPAMPGYVPVYIRNGDTPLEEINPELAEAFHAAPAGRSAAKHLDASIDNVEYSEETNNLSAVDRRAYEKVLEKKTKKAKNQAHPKVADRK